MTHNPHEIEQALINAREITPRLWWNLYQGALQTGFDKTQAFDLLKVYILGANSGGINPTTTQGPNTDNPEE
jgi:hypothetical protein